jgi:histidine triad (HIT) family protein
MDCVFCSIGSGKISAKKVYEDGKFVAFLDINPRNPGHTLMITKAHYDTFLDMPEDAAGEFMKVANRVARAVRAATKADGMNVISNAGRAAGALVPHVHFHLIPRFNNEGPVSPEALLQVKKMDDKTMSELTQKIKNSFTNAPKEQGPATTPKRLEERVKERMKEHEPEKDEKEPEAEWGEEEEKMFADEDD